MPSRIQILILAAGKGRRMGSTKQLLPYLNKTLLGSVISLANSLGIGKPMVILGHEADKIKASVEHMQAEITVNPDWQKGMGNTIAYGAKLAVNKDPELEAVMVLLADQPRISKSHLIRMVKEYEENKTSITATQYPGGGGVPAIFDHSALPDLMNLKGEGGARQIIRNHSSVRIILPDNEEIWDVDTPEDYQHLLDME